MRRWMVMTMAAVVALVPACGGGGGSSPPKHVSCSPTGTQLHISAQDTRFDTDCLAAPAHSGFSIAFDNKDPNVAHNVHILTGSGSTLFTGAIVTGVTSTTYHVPGLRPGRYVFRCDVHPAMNGVFIVK
jgi:plastocyanin